MGRKGAWEAHVNFKDVEASRRTEIISKPSPSGLRTIPPVDPRFKKKEATGGLGKGHQRGYGWVANRTRLRLLA